MQDASHQRRDWTGSGMAATCMPDDLAPDRIFLGCESQGSKGGELYLCNVGGVRGKVLVAEAEGDIREPERLVG